MYNLEALIKGWDWSELAAMLGVEIGDDSDDGMGATRHALDDLWVKFIPGENMTPEDEEAVAWIRRFLEKLAEEDKEVGYLSPLFLGIAAIESAQMMIQAVEVNLGLLWT